jgi:hypothetical protein
MDSPTAPAPGGTDLQLDVARIGTIWGPELVGGNARVRHTLEPGVSVEVDGGVLHVTNPGEGGDRNAYTGRLGVLRHSESRHLALGAGVGGGVSQTAGNWGAVDVFAVLSGAHRYARPMVIGGLGYSAPFGDHTFVVHDPGEEGDTTLRLPRNAIAQVHVGIELGPRHSALVLGASMLRFWRFEDSVVNRTAGDFERDEVFLALGAGLRLALE